MKLFSSFPSTAYCVWQFDVSQLVKFMRFQSGQNHHSDYAAANSYLSTKEICMYTRLNRKPVQDENIFREMKPYGHT